MEMVWFVWEILAAGAGTLLICCFLWRVLGGIPKHRLKAVSGALLLFILRLLAEVLPLPLLAAWLIRMAVCAGYSCMVFEGRKSVRILWGSVPELMILAADTISLVIGVLMDYGAPEMVRAAGSVRFYTMATSLMLQLLLFLVTGSVIKKMEYRFSVCQIAFFAALAAVCTAAVHKQTEIIFVLSGIPGVQNVRTQAVFVCLCFLAVLIALIILVCRLGREAQMTFEKSLEAEQANLEIEYYKNNESSIRALHELRHDISTHLHVMRGLMEEGKTLELQEYFGSIEKKYQKESTMFLTDNTLLNAVLTGKWITIQNDEIELRFSYTTKHELPLGAADFCSLMGNMMDNAIEACRKIPRGKRREIDISVGDKGDMTFIKIRNSSDGNYLMSDGELCTTKTGTRHGIGLKSIRRIAEQAGGFCDVNPQKETFTAVVMLPCRDENE